MFGESGFGESAQEGELGSFSKFLCCKERLWLASDLVANSATVLIRWAEHGMEWGDSVWRHVWVNGLAAAHSLWKFLCCKERLWLASDLVANSATVLIRLLIFPSLLGLKGLDSP